MLSHEAIQEFIEIWKEETGNEISRELALEKATHLLTIFNVIFRPIKRGWTTNEKRKKNTTENEPRSAKF